MSAAAELTQQLASTFAQIALANVVREYPGKPDHVLAGAADVRTPRDLHPVFYGSFDWHSCVHMHWLLARLYRLFPALPERQAIADVFARHFTVENVATECVYLARPESGAFERTYGWAWLLELARELRQDDSLAGTRRSATLEPLVRVFMQRYLDYLPRQRYPLRHGLHANSAFGLLFALDYARSSGARELERACSAAARRWFAPDRNVPAGWEPSGADFLSPSLVEADLMRRVLLPNEFSAWLAAFLPRLSEGEPSALFVPALVDDRTDPYIVHLDGLNFSRAWSMRGIANALPAGDPRAVRLQQSAADHCTAGMAGIASGEYVGAHWLATFAVLALSAQISTA